MRLALSIIVATTTFACLSASAADHEADAEAIAAVMQKEIARVQAIQPSRLAIHAPAEICESEDGLHEAMVATLQRDAAHLMAIPGCYSLGKGTRVAVLDFPNPLTAHIRMILPPGSQSPLQGSEYYMLPASIDDIGNIPPSLLIGGGAKAKK